MLVQLSIRDIVLIERLDLGFEAGLSVLTGETGAGKSILLDSLSLALGGRGDGGLVRHGEEKGQVTATFEVPNSHPTRHLLRENGLDDDGDLIFRRVQSADGRTKAYINDQAISVQMMRQLGQLLVEIHGQHDDRALVDTDAHRTLLDAFAGLSDDARAVQGFYRTWKDAERALKTHRAKVEAAAREADYLRSSVEELEVLSPRDGEEEELAERRAVMQKSERIAGDIAEASEFLNGNASPVPMIASMMRRPNARATRRRDCWKTPCNCWMPRSTAFPTRRWKWRPHFAAPSSIHASWSGWRNGCLRYAPPDANIMSRCLIYRRLRKNGRGSRRPRCGRRKARQT